MYNTGIKGFDKILNGIVEKHGNIIESYGYDSYFKWYYIYLIEGWEYDFMGCGSLHESTLKDVREIVKTIKLEDTK